MVTFRQIDPLFTLDLSDPEHPRVDGELKVPGLSTYLQDIGDGQLLAIGYGGDEGGLDFQTSISLFDVSDFNNPQLADSLSLGAEFGGNVSSEANEDHLAINYFAPLGLTAIPVSMNVYTPNPLNFFRPDLEHISKLVLVNTAAGRDISIYGEVDHSAFYANWTYDVAHIRRSYFVGDHIYAISRMQ